MAAEDTIRVLRVIKYTGPRSRVEEVVSKSIHGERCFGEYGVGGKVVIRAATIGEYPEVLQSPQLGEPNILGRK